MSTTVERSLKRKSQEAIYSPNGLQLLLLANMSRQAACQFPRNSFQAINFIFPPCITHFPVFSSPDTEGTVEELTNNPAYPLVSDSGVKSQNAITIIFCARKYSVIIF